MSKAIVLLGDLGSDHEGFPPTPVIAGSPDVLIDGRPVARVGDPLAPHSKPKHPPHPRTSLLLGHRKGADMEQGLVPRNSLAGGHQPGE